MRFEQLVELIERTHYELHSRAARSVDAALVIRNWLFGWYIVEYEQKGEDRAEYGSRLLPRISQQLKQAGIKGASVTNLKNCRLFYERFQVIGQTVSDQSDSQPELPRVQADRIAISQTLSDQLQGRFCLGWSQYVFLMGIANMDERRFYEIEVQENRWSLRELKRQFDSSLYERLALSRDKKQVKKLSEKGQLVGKAADLLKEPYVLEFLGLDEKNAYSESDLETAIIDKLEHFLLELGKGFLFEARQKRFTFDEDHFYVDLVFYNRLLRCYVLIDLKIGKLTHQDLGQMQMYVNYFDRRVKLEDENPTVGIVLCKKKKDYLVELTLPKNANIYASKYQLYLPSKDELRKQVEAAAEEFELKGES